MKRPGYEKVAPLHRRGSRACRTKGHLCAEDECGCTWACTSCGGRDMDGGIHAEHCPRAKEGEWVFSEKHGLVSRRAIEAAKDLQL